MTPVKVMVHDDGLHIVFADGRPEEFWPTEALVSSGPLLGGDDVLVSHRDMPDARLHVPEPELTDILVRQAPQLTKRAHSRRILRPLLALAAAIVAFAAVTLLTDFSPSRIVAGMIPEETWASVGDTLVKTMAGPRGTCADPAGERALEHMVKRLASHAPNGAEGYRVRVARLGVVNAFTVPGRRIVVSYELVEKADTPEEVAGVIAHEIGHAMEVHPEISLVRSLGLSALVSILTGGSSDVLASTALLLLQMSYSRDAEEDADDHALRLLKASGISAEPLARFFEKLEEKTGKGSELTELVSTHPLSRRRIERIRAAGKWPTEPLLSPEEWRALREICGK